jgi:hypothetical protein
LKWSSSTLTSADVIRKMRRVAPTVLAAALAIAYLIVEPTGADLPAQLLRVKLFGAEGFGIWNNWWYAGHNVPGYSVLFPAVAALLTPQLAAGIAVTGTALLFELFARDQFGDDAWLGALWFGAATATNLYTGRLPFAFGMLPAVATALALSRRRPGVATAMAVLTALCSPVAALFAGLAGGAYGISALVANPRSMKGAAWGAVVIGGALVPVGLLAVAFPEGGTFPFGFSTLWPVVLVSLVAVLTAPRTATALRAGAALYLLGCLAAYAIPTAVGSNAARLGTLVAGPVAALLWFPRRARWLALAALPLLFIQWQAAVGVVIASNDPSTTTAYYQPLLRFLRAQQGPPFRIEIPFTSSHWESYLVAPQFPLARGWERQLDIKYNHLFYGGTLNAATYDAWLHQLAVRYVAVADVGLDYSARAEVRLIDRGLPYLHLVMRSEHWRVYEVKNPTPIVSGAAALTALGANSVTMYAHRAGSALIRVHYSPYWALEEGEGCVVQAGQFTGVRLRRPGPVKLVISFALGRIEATSPRCS